ncbi:TPA: hypothetical protein ACPEYO_005307, partial [Klebsiella pneumoniae]
RLAKIKSWRETYGAGSNVMLPAEEAEELACLALAAMDSEPVAEVVSIYGDPEAFGEREIRPLVGIQQMPYGTKLYRHAQQPVVDADDNFYSWFGREWQENYQHNQYTTAAKQMLGVMAESAWKAGRRAAMLQELQKSAGVSNNCRNNEKVQDLQVGKSQVAPSPFGYVLCNHGRPDPDFVFADWDSAEGTAEHLNGDTHDLWTVEPVCLAAAPQEVSHG